MILYTVRQWSDFIARVQNPIFPSPSLPPRAMEHLKSGGVVVYLKISFEEMEKRLRNITTRGIVLVAGQGLRGMYDQRVPLYEKYADRIIDCSDKDFETVVGKVLPGSWGLELLRTWSRGPPENGGEAAIK